MGASDFDERKNRLDISRYAPPRYRKPDGDASSGPVLERLSRGPSDGDPAQAAAQPAPPDEPIHIRQAKDGLPPPRHPLSMTARLAAAMSLAAVVAAVSVTFINSKAEHSASVASAPSRQPAATAGTRDTPKPVRTVTVRREPATVGDAQASAVTGKHAPSPARTASVAERIDALAGKPAAAATDGAFALTAPLTLWAMFPGAPSAGAQDSAAGEQGTETAAAKTFDGDDAEDAAAKRAALRQQRAKAANQARRRRFMRRRARAAASQPRQQAEAARTQPDAAQPARKLPLQAAIDSIFGNGGGGNDSASAGPAPATTGAAFQ